MNLATTKKSFAVEILELYAVDWVLFGLVGLAVFAFNYFHVLNPVTNGIEGLFSPGRADVYQTVQKLSAFSNALQNVPALAAQNQQLQEQVLSLQSQLAQVDGVFQENAQLQKEAGISYGRKYRETGALVIGYNAASPGELTINKGSQENISVGDVVVVENVVVGKVSDVSAYSAKVQSLIYAGTAIPVKTQAIPLGILGSEGGSKLVVTEILQSAKVQVGDKVYTNGLDLTYPPDLYIGDVDSVNADPRASTKSAVIKPALNYQTLERVKVLSKN